MLMKLLFFELILVFVVDVCEGFCKIRFKLRLTIANEMTKIFLEWSKLFSCEFKHCFNQINLLFNSLYHIL